MGKRLVALSIVAALAAWPGFAQEEVPGSSGTEETPPVAAAGEQPVAETPTAEAPADAVAAETAPEDGTPAVSAEKPADPVATAEPSAPEDPVAEPPAMDPILPIGDEPVAENAPDPEAAPDPDDTIGACRQDTVYVRGDFGKARFTVEVAETAEQRAQGLMHVESMPASKGMLFVYPVPQEVAFWMKNTLIPLDMIFADSRGVVVKVYDSAVPGDLTSIPGGDDVQFVLEINGGLARMMGIAEGAELRHPAMRRAAWPC